ncbi:MAG TPA: reverse transcriptase/maturase family protein [Candidatus Paceibacterota bacterium]|nr:reverse transcriptase/maturase family protein [Candidatus Paceibacterota bacterium]
MKVYTKSYQESITIERILDAWQEFLRGKSKRNDVIRFNAKLMDNIYALHRDLAQKSYTHGGYHAFNISDPKPRNIHKATVRDRLLHHVLYSELYPYFDTKFIYDSYSCRIGKGTHKALYRFEAFSRIVSKNNTRTCWVLKCDIKKFFASIDHTILKTILRKHLAGNDTNWLLGVVIDSFHTEGNPDVGLPLGNLTSQLLVNVYMNEFDQFVKHHLKARYYIRYADDFVFLSDNKSSLTELLPLLSRFLKERLHLSLHPNKVFVKTLASGVDFLGWVHFPTHRVLRTATKRRMFKRVRETECKKETVQSYLGLLGHGNTEKLQQKLLTDVVK